MYGRLKNTFKKGSNALIARPMVTFFVLLALLLGLILTGHMLRQPEPEAEKTEIKKKETAIFVPGANKATLQVPTEVRKDQIMTITALTSGIVSRISTAPGSKVSGGQVIVEMTDDYGSGSTRLSIALAEEERRLTLELDRIDKRIADLEERRIKRDDTLTSTEEDIEIQELRREKATRNSDLETSRLSLEIARRNDSALKPKSPVAGTLESIAVRPGDYVTPGTALATVRALAGTLSLETLVSRETASLVDPVRPALLTLDDQTGKTVEVTPLYLSRSENQNGLFSLLYSLPSNAETEVTDGSFVKLALPLRATEATSESVLAPIDLVFQENDRAWVIVERDGRAESREVTLGRLYGSFAQITGLSPQTRIIMNRAIISGDEVTVTAADASIR